MYLEISFTYIAATAATPPLQICIIMIIMEAFSRCSQLNVSLWRDPHKGRPLTFLQTNVCWGLMTPLKQYPRLGRLRGAPHTVYLYQISLTWHWSARARFSDTSSNSVTRWDWTQTVWFIEQRPFNHSATRPITQICKRNVVAAILVWQANRHATGCDLNHKITQPRQSWWYPNLGDLDDISWNSFYAILRK